MVTYDALMKDLNNSEVELSRLPALLHELSNKIVENWLELKSNDGNIRSIRKTALKPSIKLNIITKVGHEVSEEIMRQVLAGLGISDLHIGENLIGVSTPDPKLIAAIVYTLSNVLHKDSITTYLYPMIIEGSRKLSVPFHIFIRRNGELDDFVVNVDRARSLINNPSVPDYLRSWLISAVNNWGSVKVRKGVRFVWYAVNGLFGRGSVFGWFVGDGVLGHVGRGSFDVGFSFVVDDVVKVFMSDFLCRLYGCGGRFFGGSGARGSEHYVVCPVKAVVINDIISIAKSWPGYALVDRVRELLDAVNYSTPCLGYRRHPVINVFGHELVLRKHNMGRGWYLTKVSSDKELIENIADDLRVAGFDVSVREGRHGFELYVPIEDTKKILRMLGLYERFYGEPRRLPSVDEVVKVLSSFSIKRWHVHVGKGRNSRGYEYEETCLLISLGNSEAATKLREVLASVGIRVRKVVWGTVIICNPEDRELVVKALQSLGSIGNNPPK
ncbi:MAG: hypothetical protein AT718_01125 [Vulcanisaeta sp. JCHS_4]|jgi:hypothetical protein|nr:MAG: hypothetical protein AT718_01125 [Vulcanisaeta sp. JCHS_4]